MTSPGMRYLSTRGGHETNALGAVSRGLAPDGSLYVPAELPRFDPSEIRGEGIEQIAVELLSPFFEGSSLEAALGVICEDAFNFPIPLEELDEGSLAVLFRRPCVRPAMDRRRPWRLPAPDLRRQ